MREEKRIYPRVNCEIPSTFRNLDEQGPVTLAETAVNNISEGGVRFRTDKFVALSNRIFVQLNIPKQKPITVRMQPVRIVEDPRFSQYEIGARFVDLSSEDRTIIHHLVHGHAA